MSFTKPAHLLRVVLKIDAMTCLVTGLAMATDASLIARLTQIPPSVLFYAGLSLLPIAAFILVIATRSTMPPIAVWIILLGNIGWVTGSLWLLTVSEIGPNTFGTAFVILQAAVVAVLAAVEYRALRRTSDIRPAAGSSNEGGRLQTEST